MNGSFCGRLVYALAVWVAAAALVTGCKSAPAASAAGEPGGGGSATGSATPSYVRSETPAGWQTVALMDPVLHMKAYDITIPAGWKFDGAVSPGTACKTVPFPVFRAYSPDGLTEFRRLPRFDWASSDSAVAKQAAAACPQLSTSISATDFLKYVAGTMGATVVSAWPLSDADRNSFQASIQQANANYAQSGMRGYSMTGDVGAVRTRVQNGSFVIEQQLLAALVCTRIPLPDGTSMTGCTGQVRALRAPAGRLDALVALIASHAAGAAENPVWEQVLNQQTMQRNQEIMQQRAAAFQQWSAMMAREHSQFMQQMQSEGASRTAAFQANMAAKSTVASDWVDYALSQQTVSGSGGTAKVASGYGTTWSNGEGVYYQTNDPQADPNGVLSGTWTRQQVVHGNGTP